MCNTIRGTLNKETGRERQLKLCKAIAWITNMDYNKETESKNWNCRK